MCRNKICARLMNLGGDYSTNSRFIKSFHELSAVKDSDGKPVDYLVASEEEAYDFDLYAKEFSAKRKLQAPHGGNKRTLCSVDAIYLKNAEDTVHLIEFKHDSIGCPGGEDVFRYNKPQDTQTGKNYELIVYRKFTETVLMLIADNLIDFDDSRKSISCLLVLSAKKNSLNESARKDSLDKMANYVRGPKQFKTLIPLQGALFKSVLVISETVFDKCYSKKQRNL